MLRKHIIPCLLISIIVLGITHFTIPVYAADAVLRLNPSTVMDESLTPPKTFNMTVEVLNVTNMYGYEFKLFYLNSVLNVSKAVRPSGHFMEPSDPANQFQVKWEIKNNFNATHGRLYLSFTLLAPEAPKTGSGILVKITFLVVGLGSTPITFKDTKLADSSASPIPHTAENGYFRNTAPPPPPPPALIYVDPEELIDPTLIPCQNFTINIDVENATDLYAFMFNLTYDPLIIEAIEIQEGPFLQNVGPTSVLTSEINNLKGYLVFAVTLLSPPGANGTGTLATIRFHVLEMGATQLTLQEISLANPTGDPLPYTKKDGYFANVLFATLFVDPPEIIDPTKVPGSFFTIDIKIKNIQEMYSYLFHLDYETTVLTCIGVYVNPVLNETNYSSSFSVEEWKGHILVNVSYYPPANPISTISPISLVTLTFKVDALGTSNLTLHDTEILDPNGDPIPHETENGFFQSVIRDVAVVSVTVYPTKVYEGFPVNITVVVLNKGNLSETFNVTTFYGTTPISTKTVENLAPGENRTLVYTWNTKGLPACHNYTIKAEAHPVPYETELADNLYIDGTVKIKMMGDVNGDGKVDIFDLTIIALAFGSKPGDPNWNPDADLDPNNIIDIFDLVLITLNYGKTC